MLPLDELMAEYYRYCSQFGNYIFKISLFIHLPAENIISSSSSQWRTELN